MRATRDRHSRYRELLAERLDAPLRPSLVRELRDHLLGCAACRAVDQAYREQRSALRKLPSRAVPPRDLWARTSAALDREMARERVGRSRAAARLSSRQVAAAALGISLTVVGVGTQLLSTGTRTALLPGVLLPTPFGVPAEQLAFVDHDGDGLSVYRTQVSEVCPPSAIDCVQVGAARRDLIRVPADLLPRSVAMQPRGDRVAIAARADGGDVLYVVRLEPLTNEPESTSVEPPATPLDHPDDPVRPGSSPGAGSAPPAATASATLASAPAASLPDRPAASASPTGTPPPTPALGGVATATPETTPPEATRSAGSETTASPDSTPAAPSAPNPASAAPGATSSAGASLETSPPSESVPPTGDPATGAAPTAAGSIPGVAQPILRGVLAVGAPPAWSPDGERLAFSAMPSDGTHGPDIYVWSPGDAEALPLTDDHASYFASWSGRRIVVSRAVPTRSDTGMGPGALEARTFVMDPETGRQRAARLAGLWLPAVDPSGRHAVAWQGELVNDGPRVVARSGGLRFADWTAIDPFSATGDDVIEEQLEPKASSTPSPAASASAEPGSAEPGSPEPESTATDGEALPAATDEGGETQEPSATEETTTAGASADRTPRPLRSARALRPLELGRDEDAEPVLDWRVIWSADGSSVGFWVADSLGAAWGHLSVISLTDDGPSGSEAAPLLAPTLARRGFMLSPDRVAWVAPSEEDPQGELRIRTWGEHGPGGVRIRGVDVDELLAGN